MIISTCPLRVSLIGGGTDLPQVLHEIGMGASIGFSINWKMRVVGHQYYDQLILKYSETEQVLDIAKIQHPIFRAVLERLDPKIANYEIASLCHIAGGTGLGSSSAFTAALIQLLAIKNGKTLKPTAVAHQACEAEIVWCGRRIGFQDAYLACMGGVNHLRFSSDGDVSHQSVAYPSEWHAIETSPFLLVPLKGKHDSDKQLASMAANYKLLEQQRELVPSAVKAIETSNLEGLNDIINANWNLKKKTLLNTNMDYIEAVEAKIRSIDKSVGFKLLGSGGGGFALITSKRSADLVEALDIPLASICISSTGLECFEIN